MLSALGAGGGVTGAVLFAPRGYSAKAQISATQATQGLS
jgi:hypothetical protein